MSNKSVILSGITLLFSALATNLHAAEITIKLQEVDDAIGHIRLAIYSSESTFNKTPYRALSLTAEKGEMSINVADLPAGDYAVMLFQDLDGNEKLDTNLLGIPREPWGGSLGGKAVFGPPDWESTHFSVPDSGTSITIALR